MNKKTLLTVLTVTVLGAGLLNPTSAMAASNNGSWQDHWSAMVEKREARLKERLATGVKDGKITEAQKKLILEKHEEMESQRGSKRDEMQAWAQKNGIEMQFMMGNPQGMRRGGNFK